MKAFCRQVWPIALIVFLFALWGAANNLNDILIKQFTKAFTLQDWQSGLVQSAFYVGYCVGALPAALVSRARGYKTSILVGLSLFASGAILFVPASIGGGTYLGLLGCLYLIAFGLAFLESAANPWIILLGDHHRPGGGTLALNVAQSFNPVGSLFGLLVGRFFILDGDELTVKERSQMSSEELWHYREHEASRVSVPYASIAALVALTAISFALTNFPGPSMKLVEREQSVAKVCSTVGRLVLTGGAFMRGVAAQFAYVAGQVSVWSFQIRYVEVNLPGTDEQHASDFIILSLTLFTAGRFVASALLNFVREDHLLGAFGIVAGLMCAGAATMGGVLGVVGVCASSFFMSMMYPTIFASSISRLSHDDQEVGAALVVMAIVGGAVAPPLMGYVSDISSISRAYFVPGSCFFAVALYAWSLSMPVANSSCGNEKEKTQQMPELAAEVKPKS